MNFDEPEVDTKRVNKAIGYACRILGVQEYSTKTISQKLSLKGYTSAEIEPVIHFLTENNWLSDLRFCEVFVRSKINRGQGLSRIRYELTEKGISTQLLNDVLNHQEPICWQNVCDKVTERKIDSSALHNNLKDRQRLERFLRYRGFSGEQIRNSINKYINKNRVGVEPGDYDE